MMIYFTEALFLCVLFISLQQSHNVSHQMSYVCRWHREKAQADQVIISESVIQMLLWQKLLLVISEMFL